MDEKWLLMNAVAIRAILLDKHLVTEKEMQGYEEMALQVLKRKEEAEKSSTIKVKMRA